MIVLFCDDDPIDDIIASICNRIPEMGMRNLSNDLWTDLETSYPEESLTALYAKPAQLLDLLRDRGRLANLVDTIVCDVDWSNTDGMEGLQAMDGLCRERPEMSSRIVLITAKGLRNLANAAGILPGAERLLFAARAKDNCKDDLTTFLQSRLALRQAIAIEPPPVGQSFMRLCTRGPIYWLLHGGRVSYLEEATAPDPVICDPASSDSARKVTDQARAWIEPVAASVAQESTRGTFRGLSEGLTGCLLKEEREKLFESLFARIVPWEFGPDYRSATVGKLFGPIPELKFGPGELEGVTVGALCDDQGRAYRMEKSDLRGYLPKAPLLRILGESAARGGSREVWMTSWGNQSDQRIIFCLRVNGPGFASHDTINAAARRQDWAELAEFADLVVATSLGGGRTPSLFRAMRNATLVHLPGSSVCFARWPVAFADAPGSYYVFCVPAGR